MHINRRTPLNVPGHSVILSGLRLPVLHAGEEARENPFTLGVASGDSWPDGFVLWTRLAPHPLEPGVGLARASYPVGWEVAVDENFTDIVSSGTADAHPDLGYSIHIELEGLESARRYWYRFIHGDFVSAVGTVKTAPSSMAAWSDQAGRLASRR